MNLPMIVNAAAAGGPRPDATPRAERVRVRLWLPTTVIFALLAPFALALSPLLLLAPTGHRLGPHTALAVGAVLFSLSGTQIEVEAPDAIVRIHLL